MPIIKNIPYGEHPRQMFDLYIPDTLTDGYRTIFHFHGGGLKGGNRTDHPYVHDLVSLGYIYADCDYRLRPEVTAEEIMTDCANAIAAAMRALPTDKKQGKFFIAGDSAGGYIAMMLCFRPKYLEAAGVDPRLIQGYLFDDPMFLVEYDAFLLKDHYITDALEKEDCPLYQIDVTFPYPPMQFLTYGKSIHGFPEFTHMAVATMHRLGFSDRVYLEYFPGYSHCGNFSAPQIDGINAHSYYSHKFYSSVKD